MKDLATMTAKELKVMAKELKISNWWNLKKEKLIEKITAAIAPEPTPQAQNESLNANSKETKQKTKRTNLKLTELTYDGQTKSIREWAAELEMPWPTLYDRVNRNGWTVEDAIKTPLGQRRPKHD